MADTTAKRFLITGGSKGIGASLVALAREQGHHVVYTGRDEATLNRVAEATGAVPFPANVTHPDDNHRTVDFALERMGGIDVVVNNAAYGYSASIGELDVDQMKAMFEANVFGLVDLTNRIVPLMKKAQAGDIVNIASTSGMKGHANGTAYSGSKWGAPRHHPVLAGRASPLQHSRDVRLPVRGPDRLGRQAPGGQPEEALCRGYRVRHPGGGEHAPARFHSGVRGLRNESLLSHTHRHRHRGSVSLSKRCEGPGARGSEGWRG